MARCYDHPALRSSQFKVLRVRGTAVLEGDVHATTQVNIIARPLADGRRVHDWTSSQEPTDHEPYCRRTDCARRDPPQHIEGTAVDLLAHNRPVIGHAHDEQQ